MAEVEKVEKVREMPALIKIKGLNIRENQKWKSFFQLETAQETPPSLTSNGNTSPQISREMIMKLS